MSNYTVEIELCGPTEPFGGRDAVEAMLDAAMTHLLACGVIDPSVSESYLPDGEVSIRFHMGIDSQQPDQAVVNSMAAVRGSLHAAGASTPGWEDLIGKMRSDIRATSADDNVNSDRRGLVNA